MKIGIIFFGLPRCSALTVPSIQNFIIDELKKHELFIESCLSLQTSVLNVRSDENHQIEDINYDFFRSYPHQFIEPDSLLDMKLHAELLRFGDAWEDNGASLRNLLLQLASMQKAYLNCKKNECDFYIFVRPDLIIQDPIPLQNFISRFADKHAIMLPGWQWFKGVNDRFAIASKSAADAYGLRYDHLLSFCRNSHRPIHSERFLSSQLSSHQIIIKTCTTRMSRVRASCQARDEVFSVVRRMGGFKCALHAQLGQVVWSQKLIGLTQIVMYYLTKPFKKAIRF